MFKKTNNEELEQLIKDMKSIIITAEKLVGKQAVDSTGKEGKAALMLGVMMAAWVKKLGLNHKEEMYLHKTIVGLMDK
jgi:hypothetical protein